MKEKCILYPKVCLVFLILSITSCEKKIKDTMDGYQFDVIDQNYNIYLDQQTSNHELASQYLPSWSGKEAFAFLNRKNNEIKIYELNTGLLTDSIQFQNHGPDGVGRIYEFYIHNEDSIFLNAAYSYRIFLIDNETNVINKYSLVSDDTEFSVSGIPKGSSPTALALMSVSHPPILIDDYLYLRTAPDRDPFKSDYFDSEELMIRLNLENGKYEYLMAYPDKYKNKIWGAHFTSYYFSFNEEKESFVFSFPIEDHVYETRDFESFKKYIFKSSMISEVKPMSKSSKDFSVYYKYFKNNSAYEKFLYDPHNQLYYRIGKLKIEDNSYDEYTDPLSNPQNLVIVVSDDSFNLLHEKKLHQPKHGQYISDMSFVNETGLNIAFIDYDNEDKLTFVSFNLAENGIE